MTTFKRVSSSAAIKKLEEMAHEIWNEHYVNIIGQPQVDYMLENFQTESAITEQINDGRSYFFVQDNGNEVGYFAFDIEPAKSSMFLSKIYVTKEFRGRGFGRSIIEFLERICFEKSLQKIWLTVNKGNESSIRWYERMGFEIIETRKKDIGEGFVMDDYRMEKRIGLDR
ncbi:MAG: GNAT family N-acetyltransferase [Candidatus Brocadiia bacterium]